MINEIENGEDVKVVQSTTTWSWDTRTALPESVWTIDGHVYVQSKHWSVGFKGLSQYPDDTTRISRFDTTGKFQQVNYYIDGGAPSGVININLAAKWFTRGKGNGNNAQELMIASAALDGNVIHNDSDINSMLYTFAFGILVGLLPATIALIAALKIYAKTGDFNKTKHSIHTPLIDAD